MHFLIGMNVECILIHPWIWSCPSIQIMTVEQEQQHGMSLDRTMLPQLPRMGMYNVWQEENDKLEPLRTGIPIMGGDETTSDL